MAWQEKIQKGSFRGVPFTVSDSAGEAGRRVVLHEYPFRDKPYPEDLGKSAQGGFTIECYVAGPDYMDQRDALIDALNQSGPGILVHPFHGRKSVQVISAPYRESTSEQGAARFTIKFVEAGENENPTSRINTASTLSLKSDAALSTMLDDFVANFNTAGKPQFVANAANAITFDGFDQISKLASFQGSFAGIDIGALIQNPASLGSMIISQINAIEGVTDLRRIVGFGKGLLSVFGSTPSRQAQKQNQSSLVGLFQQTAAVELANKLVTADQPDAPLQLDNREDAIEYRDEVIEYLDGFADEVSDPVFEAHQQLRVAVIQDVNTRLAQLPAVVQFIPNETTPALVLAHRLYGDATKENDIVARNHIAHSGFVPGGRPVEYLK
jgi:prophage DNA circulation protein